MGVVVKPYQPDIKEMDRAILKEAAGCAYDDEKARVYEYSYSHCVLMLLALAKKMLGIFGEQIGNNPTRGGATDQRDFNEERERITKNPSYTDAEKAGRLDGLKHEEAFANDLMQKFNPEAWRAVLELEVVLMRRGFALERAGLLRMNIHGLVAEEFAKGMRDATGKEPEVPCDGAVEITPKGLRCVSSQTWPTFKERQRAGTHRFDYDVEVAIGN